MVKEEQVWESFKSPFSMSLHGFLLPKGKKKSLPKTSPINPNQNSFCANGFYPVGIDQKYSEANI